MIDIIKNLFYFKKSHIPKETCEEIIQYGKSVIQKNKNMGKNTNSRTAGNNQKNDKRHIPKNLKTSNEINNDLDYYHRDSEVAWFKDQELYDMILPTVYEANEKCQWFFDIDEKEDIQFTVYNENGFYSWHTDGGMCHASKYKRYIYGITPFKMLDEHFPKNYTNIHQHIGKIRKISVTVNLTDPNSYEGGDLMFDFSSHTENNRFHTCKEAREQGSIVVFPSFAYHCVSPITRGKRYSLVLWNLGDPFK